MSAATSRTSASGVFEAAMRKAAPRGPLKPGGTLCFVLGDHLSESLPAIKTVRPGTDAVLMAEVKGESNHVPSHKQRATLFLSAMRHFAVRLAERGHAVRYITLGERENTQTLVGELDRAAIALKPARIALTQPGEHRLAGEIQIGRAHV